MTTALQKAPEPSQDEGAGVMSEIATLRALALTQPRDIERVMKRCLAELEAFPKFAERAYYSIPYKDKKKGTVYVEGLSIKAAMSLAREWGNGLNLGRIIGQSEERITVGGIFYDAETNVFTVRSLLVSRTYIDSRNGKTIVLRENRLKMSIAAEMSKAVRNAVLAALPESVKDTYFDAAKAIVGQLKGKTKKQKAKSFKERVLGMFDKFESELKIDRKVVGGFMTKEDDFLRLKTDEERIARMVGIFTAIKDGQVKSDEIFGDYMSLADAAKAGPKKKSGTKVNMEDLGFPDGDAQEPAE